MISRDNLIEMLVRSKANEDEFILSYGKHFLDNVMKLDSLDDDEKKEHRDQRRAFLCFECFHSQSPAFPYSGGTRFRVRTTRDSTKRPYPSFGGLPQVWSSTFIGLFLPMNARISCPVLATIVILASRI